MIKYINSTYPDKLMGDLLAKEEKIGKLDNKLSNIPDNLIINTLFKFY